MCDCATLDWTDVNLSLEHHPNCTADKMKVGETFSTDIAPIQTEYPEQIKRERDHYRSHWEKLCYAIPYWMGFLSIDDLIKSLTAWIEAHRWGGPEYSNLEQSWRMQAGRAQELEEKLKSIQDNLWSVYLELCPEQSTFGTPEQLTEQIVEQIRVLKGSKNEKKFNYTFVAHFRVGTITDPEEIKALLIGMVKNEWAAVLHKSRVQIKDELKKASIPFHDYIVGGTPFIVERVERLEITFFNKATHIGKVEIHLKES